MRLVMKGGVWKNAEDEVLKAAVMKYGLNNWSRVASLLVRKTARQCKARWYEWLDPSVKKTAWSKEEDEKLLHLAKIMPTQFKTIAPLVGRTAVQCLDRYNELLDASSGLKIRPEDDPRALRPGEIDPNPEAKPARADPVDLDEDEREMLAEARARLANTRGKKAKRKARERQLEEARRVATLQKRRELKAAGILSTGSRSRRALGGIDLENEVPFEHKPPPGFYSVGPEENPQLRPDISNLNLQQAEEVQAREKARRLKLQDLRTLKKLHEQNLPAAMAQLSRKANPFAIRTQRPNLQLPVPQVTDDELQLLADAVKQANITSFIPQDTFSNLLGSGLQSTRELLPSANLPANASAVDALTTLTPGPAQTGTQRRAAIMEEARQAVSRINAQTPLQGDEEIGGLPSTQEAPVNTPMMTPIRTTGVLTGVKALLTPTTPHVPGTPRKFVLTPVAGQMPLKGRQLEITVDRILSALPSPQNDLRLATFETSEEKESLEGENFEEDRGDEEARVKRKREEVLEQLSVANKRSKIWLEAFPRPLDLPTDPHELTERLRKVRQSVGLETDALAEEIDSEVAKLLIDDQTFLSPEDQYVIYSKPQSAQSAGQTLARSFLTNAARNFPPDFTLTSLIMAAEELDGEIALLAEPKLQEMKSLFRDVAMTPTSLLSNPAPARMLVYSGSHPQLIRVCEDPEKVAEEVDIEVRAIENLTQLKARRLKTLFKKNEVLTKGYIQKINGHFDVISALAERAAKAEADEEAAQRYLNGGGDECLLDLIAASKVSTPALEGGERNEPSLEQLPQSHPQLTSA